MTTSNEQAAKLPLMKRIVLAVRGGVGGGVSAVLVLLLILLLIAGVVGGFIGGIALATKRNQQAEQNLIAIAKNAKLAQAKLSKEKAELEHELEAAKDQSAMQAKDLTQLKEDLERARIERETMDKVLQEIRTSIQAGGASPKVAQAVKGAMLKFGNNECELKGDTVKSKDDVKCLNLRGAIDAMNSKPGGYSDKKAEAAKAAESKPAETKAPEAKPGHK
ncbi:hypothetical protein [Chitinimonas sp.]|uniref:hypothetical protein n=1 Tax=Chitinimonas sp. TaxID=1934313 RepID=UPI002F91F696